MLCAYLTKKKLVLIYTHKADGVYYFWFSFGTLKCWAKLELAMAALQYLEISASEHMRSTCHNAAVRLRSQLPHHQRFIAFRFQSWSSALIKPCQFPYCSEGMFCITGVSLAFMQQCLAVPLKRTDFIVAQAFVDPDALDKVDSAPWKHLAQ